MHVKEFCINNNIESILWIDDDHSDQNEQSTDILLTALGEQLILVNEAIQNSVKGVFIKGFDNQYIKRVNAAFKHLFDNEDVLSFEDELKQLLNSHDNPRELLMKALDTLGGSFKSTEAINAVYNYLNLGKKTKLYSFTDWQANSKEIIKSLKSQKKLMILDLQNTKEINVDFGNEGLKILEELSSNNITDEVILIVLTSTVGTSQEVGFGKELTNRYLDKANLPISVLSKTRKLDEKADQIFEEIFHRIVLVDSYSTLKSEMLKKYKESVDDVFTELKPITLEELVWCVAKNSDDDGISEFDTLMRVINHEAKRSFKKSILSDTALKELIFKCRKLDSEIEKREDIDEEAISKFHLSENFEDIDVINTLHSQISIGDIFEIGIPPKKKLYMLVGNVCNTSLRGGTGERKDVSGLLYPLVPHSDTLNKIVVGPNGVLPNYFEEATQVSIDITDPMTLEYEHLDMCWMNKDGVSKGMSKKEVEGLLDGGFLTRAQKSRLKSLMPIRTKSTMLKREISRVGRVSEARVLEIMQEYSRRLSILPRNVSFFTRR